MTGSRCSSSHDGRPSDSLKTLSQSKTKPSIPGYQKIINPRPFCFYFDVHSHVQFKKRSCHNATSRRKWGHSISTADSEKGRCVFLFFFSFISLLSSGGRSRCELFGPSCVSRCLVFRISVRHHFLSFCVVVFENSTKWFKQKFTLSFDSVSIAISWLVFL